MENVSEPFPATQTAFQATFPDDDACRAYLIASRWPDGFRCPSCGAEEAWERPGRGLFLCRRCRRETSVTSGTVLHHTHLPLATWFRAAYLVATTPGLNAQSLGRQLGLTSRRTSSTVMSRLRRSMSSLALLPMPGARDADEAVVDGVAPGAEGATGQFKRWVLATYRKPPRDERPYLDEFTFHRAFRGDPAGAFETLLGLAVTHPSPDRRPIAASAPAVASPARAALPTRAQRVAARRAMLAFAARRQRPGSGSMLHELMKARRPTMEWWRTAARLLQDKKIQIAVTGAVAANAYMPPRHTADLDLALPIADLAGAGQALAAGGWTFLGNLTLYEGLAGTAWQLGRKEVDLIGLPEAWAGAAIATALDNRAVRGLPTLTLPYVVVMKLISARPQDTADISRMLGPASATALDAVRGVVRELRPVDAEDLEQMIAAGRLEFGPAQVE